MVTQPARGVYGGAMDEEGPTVSRMKRLLALFVAAVVLAGTVVGCGSDRDRGVNSTRDKPQPEPVRTGR